MKNTEAFIIDPMLKMKKQKNQIQTLINYPIIQPNIAFSHLLVIFLTDLLNFFFEFQPLLTDANRKKVQLFSIAANSKDNDPFFLPLLG